MAKPMPEQELKAIEAVVSAHPEGIAIRDIEDELEKKIARRTLQYRLNHLVGEQSSGRPGSDGPPAPNHGRHGKSAFHPLEAPQLVEECLDQVLATAETIENPFEQAFFVMVQLPYLQPFDDVNKRVSRLAANIPLIRTNFAPLSFTDVPVKTYTEAMLGVYELNRAGLLKDVFIWACERSASRYAAVRQSLGEPDPFRLRHREALREVVQTIALERLDKKATFSRIAAWTGKNVEADAQDQFREVAENEVPGIHEGNFARYRIRPSQFKAWRDVWNKQEEGQAVAMERDS